MAENNFGDSDLMLLKDYIQFLLNNHLDRLTSENIKIAQQEQLPLLNLFTHLTVPELFVHFKQGLELFLSGILEDTVLKTAEETMQKWQSGQLPDIPKYEIQVSDVILAYSIRKRILLKFLIEFTQGPEKIIAIATAIEKMFSAVEGLAIRTYITIHEENLKASNRSLKQYQEELQIINGELQENQEEFRVLNDELKEQVEIRITTEKALEKQRNYLEAILENISDGIVACDENGMLSFFNKATRNFHGIPEKALPPEQWSSYYSLYHSDGITPLTKEEIPLFMAHKGEPVENIEMVIAPHNGKKRILRATGQQIFSSQGKNMGTVVVMHDVTALKEAEEEQQEAYRRMQETNKELATALEELQSTEEQLVEINDELELRVRTRTEDLAALNEELAAANEEILASNDELADVNNRLLRTNSDLDNFIYTASHDLKAPISNIEGLMHALVPHLSKDALQSQKVMQITDMIQGSINRFKKTIADLTELTKLQKETFQEATLVSFPEIIQDVILDLQPLFIDSQAKLEVETSQCPVIHFSSKNLRSIVYNLLSNALKYRSPDRAARVQIHCYGEPKYIVLSVKDNGLGMNLSEERKLFTMFRRLHDHVEGTGIGLYMVKKIIENAGGRIEVKSQVGEGSTFTVYFRQ